MCGPVRCLEEIVVCAKVFRIFTSSTHMNHDWDILMVIVFITEHDGLMGKGENVAFIFQLLSQNTRLIITIAAYFRFSLRRHDSREDDTKQGNYSK